MQSTLLDELITNIAFLSRYRLLLCSFANIATRLVESSTFQNSDDRMTDVKTGNVKRARTSRADRDDQQISCKVSTQSTTVDTVLQVKDLLAICLPVPFDQKYYQKLTSGEITSLEARDKTDGALVGQASWGPYENGTYLYSLAVDAKHRSEGIGSMLLDVVLASTDNDVYLHVHVGNTEALQFYESKFGFAKDKTIANFYRRLVPPDAHLLVRKRVEE